MGNIQNRIKEFILKCKLDQTFIAEVNYRSGAKEVNEKTEVTVMVGESQEPVVVSIAYADEGIGIPQVYNSDEDSFSFPENGSILIEGENEAHGIYMVTISPVL